MGPDGGVRGSCWHNDSFVIIENLFCGVRELDWEEAGVRELDWEEAGVRGARLGRSWC